MLRTLRRELLDQVRERDKVAQHDEGQVVLIVPPRWPAQNQFSAGCVLACLGFSRLCQPARPTRRTARLPWRRGRSRRHSAAPSAPPRAPSPPPADRPHRPHGVAPFDQPPLRVTGDLLGSNRQHDPDQPIQQPRIYEGSDPSPPPPRSIWPHGPIFVQSGSVRSSTGAQPYASLSSWNVSRWILRRPRRVSCDWWSATYRHAPGVTLRGRLSTPGNVSM